jgi:hypothetical protein
MVAIARVRCPEADIHNAAAEDLPFEAASFERAITEGARKYVTGRGVEMPTAVLLAAGQEA